MSEYMIPIDMSINPTSRLGYKVNLTHLLIFLVVSILLFILFKIFLKKLEDKEDKPLSKKIKICICVLGLIYFIYVIYNTVSYAMMAMIVFYIGIYEIILFCIGVLIANLVISLLINKENTVKNYIFTSLTTTLPECIVFVILASIFTIVDFKRLIIIIALLIIYKAIRICLKDTKLLNKILSIIIYTAIIITSICSIYANKIYEHDNYHSGWYIFRSIERWTNKSNRIYDETSIYKYSNGEIKYNNIIRVINKKL